MVFDRFFLWVFTLACIVGTCAIIFQAPSLYDQRMPIDFQLSSIPRRRSNLALPHEIDFYERTYGSDWWECVVRVSCRLLIFLFVFVFGFFFYLFFFSLTSFTCILSARPSAARRQERIRERRLFAFLPNPSTPLSRFSCHPISTRFEMDAIPPATYTVTNRFSRVVCVARDRSSKLIAFKNFITNALKKVLIYE